MKAKEVKIQLLDSAVAWCIDNDKSPWECVKVEEFKGMDPKKIKYHLTRSKRSQYDILTNKEEQQIITWLRQSGARGAPVTEDKLADKVKTVLQARLAYNRAHKSGKGCDLLTKAEQRIASGRGHLSHTWLSKFNARAAVNGVEFAARAGKWPQAACIQRMVIGLAPTT